MNRRAPLRQNTSSDLVVTVRLKVSHRLVATILAGVPTLWLGTAVAFDRLLS